MFARPFSGSHSRWRWRIDNENNSNNNNNGNDNNSIITHGRYLNKYYNCKNTTKTRDSLPFWKYFYICFVLDAQIRVFLHGEGEAKKKWQRKHWKDDGVGVARRVHDAQSPPDRRARPRCRDGSVNSKRVNDTFPVCTHNALLWSLFVFPI